MNKKLSKVLKDANKKLKKNDIFRNFQIEIDGDFTSIYNEIRLSSNDGWHHFPITNAETENEAVAAINAYMTGLSHGKEKSYPHICDNQNK